MPVNLSYLSGSAGALQRLTYEREHAASQAYEER